VLGRSVDSITHLAVMPPVVVAILIIYSLNEKVSLVIGIIQFSYVVAIYSLNENVSLVIGIIQRFNSVGFAVAILISLALLLQF